MSESFGRFEIVVLGCGTILLLVLTWHVSLREHRFHGVYRFFAFESLLLLVLLNWRVWFEAPFAWHQLISWILLISSIIPAVLGFRALRVVGRPEGGFENTTRLVRTGIYRYLRHPLYVSLMLLGFGVFFKQLTAIGIVVVIINFCALVATALQEELEMLKRFGSEYEAYMKETKRFIPHLF